MTQTADVKKTSESDRLLAEFMAGKEAAEKENTETPTPPEGESTQKTDEAIPGTIPTAESTEESIESLKADIATAAQQIESLSTTLAETQKALTDQNNDTWKHKFDVLDGKMKKQGPEQAKRIKDLEAELEAAKTGKPATGEEKPQTTTVTESDKKRGESWGVDPDEIASFRKDIVDQIMASIPKAEKTNKLPEGEEPPAEPKADEQPTQAPQDQAKKAFLTLVDVKARGWQEIRQKPEFAAFCNTRPGGQFGPTYLDYLKEAAQTLDADTTARVYNDFMKTVKPGPEAPKKPSREAADSRSKGGDGIPVAKEIWTPEKINQFNTDISSGKIKRDSPEYKKLKASYDNWVGNINVAG